jgi:hypothetical protein
MPCDHCLMSRVLPKSQKTSYGFPACTCVPYGVPLSSRTCPCAMPRALCSAPAPIMPLYVVPSRGVFIIHMWSPLSFSSLPCSLQCHIPVQFSFSILQKFTPLVPCLTVCPICCAACRAPVPMRSMIFLRLEPLSPCAPTWCPYVEPLCGFPVYLFCAWYPCVVSLSLCRVRFPCLIMCHYVVTPPGVSTPMRNCVAHVCGSPVS